MEYNRRAEVIGLAIILVALIAFTGTLLVLQDTGKAVTGVIQIGIKK